MSFVKYAVVSVRTPWGPEGDAGNAGGQSGTGGTSPPPAPVSPPPPPAAGDPTAFSPEQQTKFNAALAEERRKAGEQNKKLVAELETLKQSKGLSDQEKAGLQSQIDTLTATYTTKDQLQQTEIQKLQKKYGEDTTKLTETAKTWQTRYETKLKTIDLREAAGHFEAIRPEQVEKLLWDMTVVEEGLDADSKPSGEYVTMVNFVGKDKDGKAVKLKLSPRDAVKAMTEMPEEYGNLFNSKAKGGVNQQPNQGGAGNGIPNIESMTPQQWTQYRSKLREQMAKQG